MTPQQYQVEKTAIGMQYVIPGTERIVKPKRRVYRTDGDQLDRKSTRLNRSHKPNSYAVFRLTKNT